MLLPVTHLTLRVVQNCRIAAVNKWWNERFVNSATRRILHNTSCSCCSLLVQFSTSTTITATVCDCSHLSLYPGNRRYVCEEPSTTTILEKIFVITRTIYCTSLAWPHFLRCLVIMYSTRFDHLYLDSYWNVQIYLSISSSVDLINVQIIAVG